MKTLNCSFNMQKLFGVGQKKQESEFVEKDE